MTALTLTVPRMARVTWYKHRAAVLGIPGLFLLAALLLFIDGIVQRNYLRSHHLLGCLFPVNYYGYGRCEGLGSRASDWAGFLNNGRTIGLMATAASLPVVIGLFAGVPWVAREFESGAFRFTWTQNVSPRRWLLGTFGPLTLLAEVTAALCGLAAQWWHHVAQWRTGSAVSPWDWPSVELTPLSMASWTLLAMALALLLSVTIRRIVPVMLAFVVTSAACVAVTESWLWSRLLGIGTVSRAAPFGGDSPGVPWGTHVVREWFAGPHGQRLTPLTIYARINYNHPERWLAQHHYTYWIAYQPHSHLVWLQLARNGILVAVAALLVLAAVWLTGVRSRKVEHVLFWRPRWSRLSSHTGTRQA